MNDNRRIAILLSGRGSNFLAIHDSIKRRDLDAEICCVISNVETAPGLARARELGLVSLWVSSWGMSRAEYDRLLIASLRPYQPALVCLAGFMRILGAEFLKEYQGRVLNIHPSLLPSFPGLHAQRQALEHGVGVTGCTVHVVDEGVDTGPILIQRAVQIREGDTEDSLSSRILEQEHSIYWRAIGLVLDRNSANRIR
jgi:phosphoribosylglycinamide formyltransferase 1